MNLRLKRLELCLGHMQSVPPNRIVLTLWGTESLTGVGHDQKCGTVGCMAGHIQTIPEYREWEQQEYGEHDGEPQPTSKRILEWLQYQPTTLMGPFTGSSAHTAGCQLFSAGAVGELGKQEAVRRLQHLIDLEVAQ